MEGVFLLSINVRELLVLWEPEQSDEFELMKGLKTQLTTLQQTVLPLGILNQQQFEEMSSILLGMFDVLHHGFILSEQEIAMAEIVPGIHREVAGEDCVFIITNKS